MKKNKILVGVCGLGNGHSNRCKLIIEILLSHSFELCLITSDTNAKFFQKNFPNIPLFVCPTPWISTNDKGLNYKESLDKHMCGKKDYYETFLRMGIFVENVFNGNPDIVITDYEPFVAMYSNALKIPLINIEQQSKFYLLDDQCEKFEHNEELPRLNLFFPRYDLKIVSSFFPVTSDKNNIVVIPPIVENNHIKAIKTNEKKVIVYFSPYCQKNIQFIDLLNMLRQNRNYTYHIYTNLKFESFANEHNMIFCNFSDNFKKDMLDCNFIIGTSGHQLISESIYCEKPILVLPLGTFEQNFNAMMVEKYFLGKKLTEYSTNFFNSFVLNLDMYKQGTKKMKEQYKDNWKNQFMKHLLNFMNN